MANDPKIRYDILANAEGGAEVEKLAAELLKLDKAVDPATAQRAQALANELRELGAQTAAVARFRELKDGVQAAGVALETAQAAAQKLAQELAQSEAPTRAQVGQLQKLRDAVSSAKTELQGQTQQLDKARAELSGFGISSTQVAEASIRLKTALAAARTEAKDLGAAAAVAGKSLNDAFNQTGTRSSAAIQAELRSIDDALTRIAQDSKATGADFDRAFNASRVRVEQLRAELAGVAPSIDKATRSTSLLSDGIRQAAVYFSAFTVGKQFIDANTQIESLRRTLTLVTGSTETAAKQIAFLRKTADDSGVAIGSIAQAYSKFVASAGAAGISLATVNRTFAAVTAAAGNLGLSSDETSAALTALGQSASKGRVSMEELSQQLGDRLPAVLATTAKGLGISTSEMIKLITAGNLLADNSFFEAFSRGVEDTFVKGGAKVAGFNAELGRLKNEYNAFLVSLGDSGVLSALTSTLQLLGPIVAGVGAAFVTLGKTIGTVTAAAVDLATRGLTLDFSGWIASLKQGKEAARELADELGKSLPDAARYLDVFGVRSKEAADGTKALGEASKDAAGKVVEAGAAADGAAKSHAGLASTSTQAGAAASTANDRWVSLTVAYDKLIDSAEKAIESSTKLEKAKKAEGAAAVALAELAGNEIRTREAVSAAAEGNARALAAVASARESEADLVQIKIEALRQEAIDTGTLTEARKKELTELEQKLPLLRAEATASKEAAEGARIEANVRAIAIQLVKDNSGALAELKEAYENERAALVVVTSELKRGLATKEEVQEATRRVAAAEALYHDALNDTTTAIGRKIDRQKLALDVTLASLNAEKASLDSQADLARLQGNEALALDARIKLKQVEIRIIEAKVAATKLEALATLAKAEADKAALEAEGKLTDEKRLAIEAAIAGARVKQLEADASAQRVKVIQQEIDNLRLYGDEAGKARDKSKNAADSESSALDRNSDSQDRNTSSRRKNIDTINAQAAGLSASFDAANKANKSILTGNTYNAQGLATDASGQVINAGTQAKVGDGQFFDKAAYDAAVAAAFRAGSQRIVDPQKFVKPIADTTIYTPQQIIAAELARLDAIKGLNPTGSAGGSTPLGSAAPAPAPKAPTAAPTSTRTINLQINGTSAGTVNVTSQRDADALQSFMTQLEQSARAAGFSF